MWPAFPAGSILLSGSLVFAWFFPQHPLQATLPPHGIITNPDTIHNQQYDYIIAGGGLTGLTVAASLINNTDATVLVIENGFYGWEYGPIIDDLNTYGQIFGSAVDHAYQTVPLTAHNRTETIRLGNGLGGSTLINGGTWTRPAMAQLNSWESVFQNTGWNWDNVFTYMNQIERARDLHVEAPDTQHNFDPACHGTDGFVNVGARNTYNDVDPDDPHRNRGYKPWSNVVEAYMNTAHDLCGAPIKLDLCCGNPQGVSMFPNSLYANQTRADAARESLLPVIGSTRLAVLLGQQVGRVLLGNTTDGSLRATGVEYGTHRDAKYNVDAKEEVLVSAGSAISPLILQHSGIGPRKVLERANVAVNTDLPVGLWLQDQTTTTVAAHSTEQGPRQGQAAYFATFREVFGDGSIFEEWLKNDDILTEWAKDTVEGMGIGTDDGSYETQVQNLLTQYKNYRTWLLDDEVAYAEIFLDTDSEIHFDIWTLIPFTRGYVHILDADPYLNSYHYNPRYFENPLDIFGQAGASKLARDLLNHGDLNTFNNGERIPGYNLSDCATLDDWAVYVRNNFRANYHGVGTCSMMAQALGGVVDSEAKVYGVDKLRVIDGSIPPTQVSSHVMTVFYAMAAKIAELIAKAYNEKQQVSQKGKGRWLMERFRAGL
ncbi:glucose oxidase precursor [Aspergillus cavernicola]|uniref:glucose oxidase n=1 Tax=Aspergillus cavernicola TaxID=176166 RepID=A0ABR4IDS4_9EURO